MRVRDMQQRPWLWPPASACPNRERLLDRPHAGDWERTGAPLQVPIREATRRRFAASWPWSRLSPPS